MAITAGQVTTTSTLEQFRVEFNKLQTDVSGIEAGSLSFTNISATQISVAELTGTSTLSAASFIFEGSTDDGIGEPLPEFIAFAIKIVGQGTNAAEPVRIRDLRVIALAT